MGEEFKNGDKLAATREDLARFEGATQQQLSTIIETVARMEQSMKDAQTSLRTEILHLTRRVDKLERRDWHEDQSADDQEARDSRRHVRSAELRAWIGIALTLVMVAFTLIHH